MCWILALRRTLAQCRSHWEKCLQLSFLNRFIIQFQNTFKQWIVFSTKFKGFEIVRDSHQKYVIIWNIFVFSLSLQQWCVQVLSWKMFLLDFIHEIIYWNAWNIKSLMFQNRQKQWNLIAHDIFRIQQSRIKTVIA